MKTTGQMETAIQSAAGYNRQAAGVSVRTQFAGRTSMVLALAFANMATPARSQDEFNILANDYDRQFTPTIIFSDSAGEKLVAIREAGGLSIEAVAKPERVSALVVANLVQFPFGEIAEDMPVSVSIGAFEFSGVLGDDAERRLARSGAVVPFNPQKASAVFRLTAEVPGPSGTTRTRMVGSVRFAWTLRALAIRVVVEDAEQAGKKGIYDTAAMVEAAAFDPSKGGLRRFRNEPVAVSVGFGSASGARTVFGYGRVESRLRRIGSANSGDGNTVALTSLAAMGKADLEPPKVALSLPAEDGNGDGRISFNGTITDLAPGTLSGAALPNTVRLFIDDVEKFSDGDAPDFTLSATGIDPNGTSIFTISELALPVDDATSHRVAIEVSDGSGNVRLMDRPVAVKRPGF